MMNRIGRERGWPPSGRAEYDALRRRAAPCRRLARTGRREDPVRARAVRPPALRRADERRRGRAPRRAALDGAVRDRGGAGRARRGGPAARPPRARAPPQAPSPASARAGRPSPQRPTRPGAERRPSRPRHRRGPAVRRSAGHGRSSPPVPRPRRAGRPGRAALPRPRARRRPDAAGGLAVAARAADAGRVAVWASRGWRRRRGRRRRCWPGWPSCRSTRSRARASSGTSCPTARPGWSSPRPATTLPAAWPVLRVDLDDPGTRRRARREPDGEAPALIVYTSGTTGAAQGRGPAPPRDRRPTWTRWRTPGSGPADDVLVHALPLFHVHGLVLGMLGPLRRGGSVRHLGRFSPGGRRRGAGGGATMLFGVPTMYHRIADAAEDDPELAEALGGARLLVSGSAALPAAEHAADRSGHRPPGHRALRHDGDADEHHRPRRRRRRARLRSGRPLPGVELRLVDDDGSALDGRRRRDGRRDPGPRPEPVHRVPQPPRRHGRGDAATAGSAPATWPCATPTATSGSSAAGPPT